MTVYEYIILQWFFKDMPSIFENPSRTQIRTASKLLVVQGYHEALEAPRRVL